MSTYLAYLKELNDIVQEIVEKKYILMKLWFWNMFDFGTQILTGFYFTIWEFLFYRKEL